MQINDKVPLKKQNIWRDIKIWLQIDGTVTTTNLGNLEIILSAH
jgi:hypothetical protein